ncbi:MAG: CRISPR-ssociated protein, Cas2 [uncultured bacterium]|nr:MAG: CRISPR-ssociated protein, Cas2 [uncultured bacterium]
MSTIIESLEEMAQNESKVRAILKRSLAFDPGLYPPAFPYVEYRLTSTDGNWKRTVYYLVAGLWALNWRENQGVAQQSLPEACRMLYDGKDKSPSIEKRFIALLDVDETQLAHRLRQMISLLKDYAIDFNLLLEDLLSWKHPDKFVQIKWAKIFYQTETLLDNEPENNLEEKQ